MSPSKIALEKPPSSEGAKEQKFTLYEYFTTAR